MVQLITVISACLTTQVYPRNSSMALAGWRQFIRTTLRKWLRLGQPQFRQVNHFSTNFVACGRQTPYCAVSRRVELESALQSRTGTESRKRLAVIPFIL